MALASIFLQTNQCLVGDVAIYVGCLDFSRTSPLVPYLSWVDLGAMVNCIYFFPKLLQCEIEPMTIWLADEHASHYAIIAPCHHAGFYFTYDRQKTFLG